MLGEPGFGGASRRMAAARLPAARRVVWWKFGPPPFFETPLPISGLPEIGSKGLKSGKPDLRRLLGMRVWGYILSPDCPVDAALGGLTPPPPGPKSARCQLPRPSPMSKR